MYSIYRRLSAPSIFVDHVNLSRREGALGDVRAGRIAVPKGCAERRLFALVCDLLERGGLPRTHLSHLYERRRLYGMGQFHLEVEELWPAAQQAKLADWLRVFTLLAHPRVAFLPPLGAVKSIADVP